MNVNYVCCLLHHVHCISKGHTLLHVVKALLAGVFFLHRSRSLQFIIKAETRVVTNRCDTSRQQVLSSALMLRQVAAIRHLFGARNRFWKRGNVN